MHRLSSLRKSVSMMTSSPLLAASIKLKFNQNKSLTSAAKQQFSIIPKPRGDRSLPYELKEGDIISGFKVKKIQDISLYSIRSYQLEHEKTKAQYIHLHAPDPNNCFAVLLRTTPHNDKGTAHILEHIVLCGSEKYPVRDPFMNMLKRSLNTYMNAWTGADFTCYPFSSQNEKDFKNLMDVYLQSVYKPLINHHDFLQEGWRYDFQKENDPESDLVFKGVVYNEMKGVMQTPDNLFVENLQKTLYKDNPYYFSSGGLPSHIPKLSYEELKDFYKRFYHPSNSYFYSYGDLDFREHLKFIDDNYLKKSQYLDPKTEVPLQERYREPVTVHVKSPPDAVAIEPGKETKLGLSFLCNIVVDSPVTSFSLQILSYMLFDTPSSPFYQTLIESGIASGYCPGYGYDMNNKQGIFTIGVRNVNNKSEDLARIENVINETLKLITEQGFEKEFIESALHQAEIHAKLPKTDFGLGYLQAALTFMNHRGDPLSPLRIDETLKQIREKVEEGGYFENLVKTHLIENSHRIKLIMTPDENFASQEAVTEKETLAKRQKELDEATKSKIIKQVQKYLTYQH